MSAISCQVQSITSLTPSVYKVILVPEKQQSFLAGQYLQFVMDEQDKRPFSIANKPEDNFIELQIGAFGEESYAMQVIDRIKQQPTVNIEMPFGDAYLREESDRPILLLAGGTGFSYIKSIFEHLQAQNSTRTVVIYWGLRELSAGFEFDKTSATIAQLANARFIPVIENASNEWQGKTGLVHEAVMQDITDLNKYDIYLAGRFDMVGKIREDFIAKGALPDRMFADAFAYI
jgi:aquacobalamin reductase/NAD(P)H-flavin reductase